jgi:hypothetical protein
MLSLIRCTSAASAGVREMEMVFIICVRFLS